MTVHQKSNFSKLDFEQKITINRVLCRLKYFKCFGIDDLIKDREFAEIDEIIASSSLSVYLDMRLFYLSCSIFNGGYKKCLP